MRLDELDWYQHADANDDFKCADVDSWHLCRCSSTGTYTISRATGRENDGSVAIGDVEYDRLDAITTQAVLYELLGGSSDGTS